MRGKTDSTESREAEGQDRIDQGESLKSEEHSGWFSARLSRMSGANGE
jgi:hypothetical protein